MVPWVSPVTWVVPGLMAWAMQDVVMAALVHTVAVYDDGSWGPADAVKVTAMAPAVVADDATEKFVGALTWLIACCEDDETPELAEAKYPEEALASTAT